MTDKTYIKLEIFSHYLQLDRSIFYIRSDNDIKRFRDDIIEERLQNGYSYPGTERHNVEFLIHPFYGESEKITEQEVKSDMDMYKKMYGSSNSHFKCFIIDYLFSIDEFTRQIDSIESEPLINLSKENITYFTFNIISHIFNNIFEQSELSKQTKKNSETYSLLQCLNGDHKWFSNFFIRNDNDMDYFRTFVNTLNKKLNHGSKYENYCLYENNLTEEDVNLLVSENKNDDNIKVRGRIDTEKFQKLFEMDIGRCMLSTDFEEWFEESSIEKKKT